MGLKAALHVADNVSDVASRTGRALPLSKYVDLTTSSRHITANLHPHIKRVACVALGGSRALELVQNHPELKSITYVAPVLELN